MQTSEIPVGYYGELGRGITRKRALRRLTYVLATGSLATLLFWGLGRLNDISNPGKVSSFATRIRDELSGRIPLAPDERLVPRVIVTAAGRSSYEAAEMDRSRTPVKVRNYPGTNFSNGADTKVIGTVALGTEIAGVIMTSGTKPLNPDQKGQWGAFYCEDIRYWRELIRKPQPGEICAIYSDYLKSQQVKTGSD